MVRAIAREVTNDSVEVLALSSHGETIIPVDEQKHAIGPAILNADNRAVAEAHWLAEKIGREKLFEITGLVAHSMYPLPKILWLRVNGMLPFSSLSAAGQWTWNEALLHSALPFIPTAMAGIRAPGTKLNQIRGT